MNTQATILEVEHLEICVPSARGFVPVVEDFTMSIGRGEILGIMGETGAGKSLSAAGAINRVPSPAILTKGDIRFKGTDLHTIESEVLRQILGNEVSMIVQSASTSLNPTLGIGKQLANVYRAHNASSKAEGFKQGIQALEAVRIPNANRRAKAYPHQISGGMAQRVLIAMALINEPELVIADEPTTGLDVTVQAEVLDQMAESVSAKGAALWLITHDLGIVANYTERLATMFAGEVVELGATRDLFAMALHPYTRGLVDTGAGEITETTLTVAGSPPNLVDRPPGCQFAYRCPISEDHCREERPDLTECLPGHSVRCFVVQRDVCTAQRQRGIPRASEA